MGHRRNRGRSTAVVETWKPTCCSELGDTFRVLRIRYDQCLRKRGHSTRCVGRHYVWDKSKVREFEERLTK